MSSISDAGIAVRSRFWDPLFDDELLEGRHADLLFTVELASAPGVLYILFWFSGA